jgi:hypothetical protein
LGSGGDETAWHVNACNNVRQNRNMVLHKNAEALMTADEGRVTGKGWLHHIQPL